jgi:hypothetical protein
MEKDVQFVFRVEAPLREQFVYLCKGMDRSAGQVLREYMRTFVRENMQAPLFDDNPSLPPSTATFDRQDPA